MGSDHAFRLWADSSWLENGTEYLMRKFHDSYFKTALKHRARASEIAISGDY